MTKHQYTFALIAFALITCANKVPFKLTAAKCEIWRKNHMWQRIDMYTINSRRTRIVGSSICWIVVNTRAKFPHNVRKLLKLDKFPVRCLIKYTSITSITTTNIAYTVLLPVCPCLAFCSI